MRIFDQGSGPTIVVVPGVQGRWEWMAPGLEALAAFGRVVSVSLCGEPGSGCALPPGATFDAHVAQLDSLLDRAGVEAAAVCGVSFGGWVALRYAARRPDRVVALVLVSAPGPRFRPDRRQARYLRAPWLTMPLFVAGTRRRLVPEIRAALPDRRERWRFTCAQLARIARAPMAPALMARRVRLALAEDFLADCTRVTAPTLVVTGEPDLDRVIPAASTREYLEAIPGARAAVVPRTGHIGIVTRPAAWASVVGGFVREVAAAGRVAGLARIGPPAGAERAAPDRVAAAPEPRAGARM
jgi:pimeloyl-ACP methyl ester carboxylesterase